mgnify:CR=1 FL=1
MKILELCPCCGDYGFLMTRNSDFYDLPLWYVQCHNCGLRTSYGEKYEVIRKWNRRVKDEQSEDGDTEMD